LLSGGMDSIALAWGIRPDLALTIDYGQLAAQAEIRAASTVCQRLDIPHRAIKIDCSSLGSGDMAGTDPAPVAPVSEWWPFRNQLIITFGAAVALREGMSHLLIGSVSSDGVHADGKREFFESLNLVLQLQEGAIVLEAPAIEDTTVSLCRRVAIPFEVLAWSHSCHVSNYACGWCRGCRKHRESMRELGYGEY
jgi:7-cyano-7-deazaguanine synthase